MAVYQSASEEASREIYSLFRLSRRPVSICSIIGLIIAVVFFFTLMIWLPGYFTDIPVFYFFLIFISSSTLIYIVLHTIKVQRIIPNAYATLLQTESNVQALYRHVMSSHAMYQRQLD